MIEYIYIYDSNCCCYDIQNFNGAFSSNSASASTFLFQNPIKHRDWMVPGLPTYPDSEVIFFITVCLLTQTAAIYCRNTADPAAVGAEFDSLQQLMRETIKLSGYFMACPKEPFILWGKLSSTRRSSCQLWLLG